MSHPRLSVPALPAFLLIAAAALSGCAFARHAPEQRQYAVRQQWALGAATRWDYLVVDPLRRRLFVTRGERVQVIDPDDGRPLGEIPGTAGVHGIALAPDMRLGFASNGRANSVTVFDLDTLAVKQEVPAGGLNPDAILFTADMRKLYTFNGKSGDVSVFHPEDMRLLATIPVGGKPEFAVADRSGHIFVNIEDKAEVVEIDGRSDRVLAHWPLGGCEEPSGLALDAARQRLFSVCANRVLAVTDSTTGRPVARVAIGAKPDAVVYDAGSGTVFSSNGDGTLSIIHQRDADHYEVTATVPTQQGARTMAFDPWNDQIYLPVADEHGFKVLVVAK